MWPRRASIVGATQGGLFLEPEKYPAVRRDDSFVETVHGVQVADPYRWLEDPNSDETKQFVEAQNKLTAEVLAECPTRATLKTMISDTMDFPKRGVPWKRGDRWYYFYNTGLQNQDAIYSSPSPDDDGSVFFDPNLLSDDGTVSLGTIAFSPDGKVAAYSLSTGGSDWKDVKAMSVDGSGSWAPLDDHIQFVRYSGLSWSKDGKGFFYSGYEPPKGKNNGLGTETESAVNQKMYYHRLGTDQNQDVCIFCMPENPTWMCGGSVSHDGRWLWISIGNGCEPTNKAYVCDLSALGRTVDGAIDFAPHAVVDGRPTLPVTRLADTFAASWSLVTTEGSKLVIQTNHQAPRQRLVALDMDGAADGALTSGAFTELLAQHSKDLLQGATALQGDLMIVQWMRDVADVAEVRRVSDGSLLAPVALPTLGTMSGVVTEPFRASTEFWFSLSSFTEPSAIYRADAATALASAHAPAPQPRLFHRTQLKISHDPEEYETRQVFVRSRDGTRVPMFVVHRRGIALDGSNPTLLYGYGGFNVSLQPSFSATRLVWMKAFNAVFALANLRGGGEYGRAWRDDGSKLRKQNVFDDFHACAERLVEEGYCTPSKLTIQGGSNGGLLVAAAANQRPDLYGAVLCQVGVLDMLRFHKFTIGHAWCTDFGDPDDPQMFDYIRRYSPYHNVRVPVAAAGGGRAVGDAAPQQYPAMILTTADHDDRVVPLHTFKMLAQLQHTLASGAAGGEARVRRVQRNPIVARIDVSAGHGAGKPTQKVIEEVADLWAFAAAATGAQITGA